MCDDLSIVPCDYLNGPILLEARNSKCHFYVFSAKASNLVSYMPTFFSLNTCPNPRYEGQGSFRQRLELLLFIFCGVIKTL